MIKAIIFDFYGVVCNEIGTKWYTARPSPELVPSLKMDYDTPSDYGRISEVQFFSGIAAAVGKTGAEVRKEWFKSAMINNELMSYVKELKSSGYKTALCSNTVSELFRELIQENDIQDSFDVIVASSEIGMVKPYPEIFKHTLDKLRVKASEAIFVDDRLRNCEGAKAVGIRSFVFEDAQKLKDNLKRFL